MEIKNWEQLVVVTAVHGEKYLGWIPKDKGDPKKYMNDSRRNNVPVVLTEVRNYLSQTQPSADRAGRVTGWQKMHILLPLDMFTGPMKKMSVMASAWYFPKDNPDSARAVEELLEGARKNEAINQAVAAGITPAGGMIGLPPPPGAKQH